MGVEGPQQIGKSGIIGDYEHANGGRQASGYLITELLICLNKRSDTVGELPHRQPRRRAPLSGTMGRRLATIDSPTVSGPLFTVAIVLRPEPRYHPAAYYYFFYLGVLAGRVGQKPGRKQVSITRIWILPLVLHKGSPVRRSHESCRIGGTK